MTDLEILGYIPIEIVAEILKETNSHFKLIDDLTKTLPDARAMLTWTQPERQLAEVIQRAVQDAKILKASKSADETNAHIRATKCALVETVRESIPSEFITHTWSLRARSFVQDLKKISSEV